MTDDTHSIRGGALAATIKAQGAELCSLKHDSGLELIWQAGPEWPRHAPLLFPIVGRLKNDELHNGGQTYRLTQHGFARDRRFICLERTSSRCVLELCDDAATRALYPFAFRLVAAYTLDDAGLELMLTISNTGEETLPASLGGHPAFNWPLKPGLPKESYALTFAADEPNPIRRLEGGLLRAALEPTPVRGKVLPLSEALFTDDAIILDQINSSSIRYAAGQGPWVEVSWSGFREVGIWSKPSGAPFLCIEPWRGTASPAGFDGAFTSKPGVMHIAPGGEEILSFRIAVGTST
ncbi:aldose 1-epimerase family protein [Bradyrhizobium sp. CCGUVB1N3]|uniref:aldose 1-epimerase family protein n=1 Tax=Bradyrhizobium sp. CCGUVB1N3 TaxID=2949629 RepID=UPI0020B1F975|nr:aldose 1-epimerase family protein [Bradyrhizobium sp. CCGUVB1N3]MCP3472121.1 aldose 1-epimerase family protein [Bradyrhizobium sp. CCGUVB1N3]